MLIVSGALGFHVGAGAFADWQVAVESAQVLAGLVEYPAGNPFYIYHTKLWTILHQLLALPLASGASERTLSVVVSGLLGMVSFQALSLIAFAVSRDILIAVGAAALIFFSRVAEVGSVYPIWLVGTSHTYGILALSYAALVVGFIGCGWYRYGTVSARAGAGGSSVNRLVADCHRRPGFPVRLPPSVRRAASARAGVLCGCRHHRREPRHPATVRSGRAGRRSVDD